LNILVNQRTPEAMPDQMDASSPSPGPASRKINVCIIQPFDPRGKTVGGIQTYMRDYITYHPADMHLLIIGVDGLGDLELDKMIEMEFRGRRFSFLPILRFDDTKTKRVARRFLESQTFLFGAALLKRWRRLKALLRDGKFSVELRRPEFAFFPAAWRIPFIQMHHSGAEKGITMSSMYGRLWFFRLLIERLALVSCEKFYCVSPVLQERMAKDFPGHSGKLGLLTTWANPEIFRPYPFELPDDKLRLVYAGRFDLFKAPNTMFSVVAELRRLCEGKLEFHYVGDGEAERFPAFSGIQDITVRQGRLAAQGVADVMKICHIGILTSDFEGMPRFVLECLSAGRPVCALHLPQLEDVIHDGKSGFLVDRGPDYVERMASRIFSLWREIAEGKLSPNDVSNAVAAYRPQRQLAKIFSDHARLHETGKA
jgi:glycosyltransferase involved in cell wall biosynthesis